MIEIMLSFCAVMSDDGQIEGSNIALPHIAYIWSNTFGMGGLFILKIYLCRTLCFGTDLKSNWF